MPATIISINFQMSYSLRKVLFFKGISLDKTENSCPEKSMQWTSDNIRGVNCTQVFFIIWIGSFLSKTSHYASM